MENISTVALSRLVAQSHDLEVMATNLANANTPGFHAERTQFTAWFAREPASAEPPGGGPVSYAQEGATYRDATPGAMKVTGNPLDLAIGDPDGWFTVATPNGPRLTRAGQFQLDANGQVVTAQGYPLLDANGRPLQTQPSDTRLKVTGDGTLASENGPIGRIGVVTVADANTLVAEGGALFRASQPTQPSAQPRLVQGAVEGSNVQPVIEVARMMSQLREYQLAAQMVQGESDRQSGAIDKILHPATQG